MSYFTSKETSCRCGCGLDVTAELLKQLTIAREIAKVPFVITSGARCEAHNKAVGGKKESSHLNGSAVDIACDTSRERFDIINGLLSAGFNRIGVAKTFIHADLDSSKVHNVVWVY